MRPLPLALSSSSPRSPLLGAYALMAEADFAACLDELDRQRSSLNGFDRTEAALLRARALLRLERPVPAIAALNCEETVTADADVRCSVESLRGFALVFAGRRELGMQTLRTAIAEAEEGAHPFVRAEALYNTGFAHLLCGDHDEAERFGLRAGERAEDLIAARALALRGWAQVGRSRYADALPLFVEAWRMYGSCSARDAAFGASTLHAIATYDLQLLERDDAPRYYAAMVPHVSGTSLGTFRLLVSGIDAWRAALAGDHRQAVAFAVTTDIAEVAPHWRVFAASTRAGIAQAFGDVPFAQAFASFAARSALTLDWNGAPGESRLGLLYLAERLALFDAARAKSVLATYTRISTAVEPRFFRGAQPLHRAVESHARGVVASALGDPSARQHLRSAHATYERMGFRWRAAAAQLQLGQEASPEGRRAYHAAHAFLVERFPRSYLTRTLRDYAPPFAIPVADNLTPSHVAIVRALCAGKTPAEIAAERGTSPETVRNQLKQIYRRAGLHSVAEVKRRYGTRAV